MAAVGWMDKRVLFQNPVVASDTDSSGQLNEEWTDAFTVWAQVRSPRGAETQHAEAEIGYRSTVVETNFREDVSYGMRGLVVGTSRILEVVSPAIDVTGRGLFVSIICREKMNEG